MTEYRNQHCFSEDSEALAHPSDFEDEGNATPPDKITVSGE